MAVMRRTLLVVGAVIVPFAITAVLYVATLFLLAATSRTIDPQILQWAAVAEFAAFLFLMLLEVKSRW